MLHRDKLLSRDADVGSVSATACRRAALLMYMLHRNRLVDQLLPRNSDVDAMAAVAAHHTGGGDSVHGDSVHSNRIRGGRFMTAVVCMTAVVFLTMVAL